MSQSDLRRIGVLACIILVVLRLAIGWQLLYEGMYKLETQSSAKPWTAEPYLKNAQGPFRQSFREMTGDPNDLRDLDFDTIKARWTGWSGQFKSHYALNENQTKALDLMIVGPKQFARVLEKLPEGVQIKNSLAKAISYNAEKKQLIVNGERHFTPREKRDLLKQVGFKEAEDKEETAQKLEEIKDPVVKTFVDTVLKIYLMQSRLSYLKQAKATLQGDPKLAGKVDDKQAGTLDEKTLGQIEFYRMRLNRYEGKMRNAKTHFDREHLAYDWKEIQQLRSELVGPIRKLESDMKWKAQKLLSSAQIAKGPLKEPMTAIHDLDLKTMWTLMIVGGLLIAGLFTRLAALAGAFLIFQFYLAYPPLPGYPHPPGPEHSLIVNKNMVEILVLLALVFLPTGRWFGIDALFPNWFASKDAYDDGA